MTHRPGKHPRISRDELDRLFDRELDASSRRDLVGRLPGNQDAIDEINDIRGIAHSMRLRPNETPDMTAAILDRLDGERGFVPARMRRRIKAGRLAAAACLLLGLLGVTIGQRSAPEWLRLHDEPTPVADFTDAVRQDSAETRERLAETVRTLSDAQAGSRFSVPDQTAGDQSRTARMLASISTDDNPGLAISIASPLPEHYLTLTVSADAEVLAFDADAIAMIVPERMTVMSGVDQFAFADEPGAPGAGSHETDFETGIMTGFEFGLAFAFASPEFGPFPSSLPVRSTARVRAGDTIGLGVLPLSFMGQTRSAYIGKRDPLAEAISAEPRDRLSDPAAELGQRR